MRTLGLIALVGVLLGTAIVKVPLHPTTIVMEAEGYSQIKAPMQVSKSVATGGAVSVGAASGGAWIALPLGSGQGWRGHGGGSVTYRVETPNAGSYRVWIRALWGDGCTNALFLRVNDGRAIVFGNDAVFKQWHWVKSLPLSFRAGVNVVEIANHSDGIAFDKLIVTDDPQYVPEGVGEGISRFFDGFAGCDADNTGSWEQVSGTWRVVKAVGDSASGANDCIAQWAPEGGVAVAGYAAWQDYDVKVGLMFSGPATAGLTFGRDGPGSEYQLLWEAGDATSRLKLVRIRDGAAATVAERDIAPVAYDRWYVLGIDHAGGVWKATLNGEAVPGLDLAEQVRGQIGLVTIESGGVYFDNVDVAFRK